MSGKHFFKSLTLFILMIVIGLIGFFALNKINQNQEKEANANSQTEVAK
jgi:preprotein translocase subunit YajC